MLASTLVLLLAQVPSANAAGSGEWLVGTGAGVRAAASMPGAPVVPGVRVVRGNAGAARRLRRAPGVRWVEPNRRFEASAETSDPLVGQQWALREADVQGAWWTSIGGEVTVAVLDSGVDASHADLRENLWTNPGEVPGNGVDDDRNGFVDDVHGADVVNGDGDPADGLGHGTSVAGLIGARGDNGFGISGVARQVRILPVKVLHDRGWGTTSTLVAGLRYALAQGARVVNMSVNGPDGSRALDDAIRAAEARGVVVVVSAGNDAADRDSVPSYPASVPSPAVVSVASTARGGSLAETSAHGATSVDLAAPGDSVLTTDTGGGYALRSGTSFAAAHVSGAVALLAAANPTATGEQLREALVASTRASGRLDGLVASGQLDVAAAVERLVPGAGPRVKLERRRAARPRCAAQAWRARGDVGAIAAYRVRVNGRGAKVVAASAAHSRSRCSRRLRPGRNRVRVTALDSAGKPLATLALTIRLPGNSRTAR